MQVSEQINGDRVVKMQSILLATFGAFSLFEALSLAAAPNHDRPNMVVILVDDLRWDETGAAGHPFLETPNIDRIAWDGARFVNVFTVAPLCSPSRASFLTGQYPVWLRCYHYNQGNKMMEKRGRAGVRL